MDWRVNAGWEMPIGEILQQIAAGWPDYHKKEQVDETDPVHTLVTKALREDVRSQLPEFGQLKFKGSTGAGNITAAPWFAVFDPRVTKSATSGYYVVYLFSVDLKTVTLCIAFGTTQFEKQFGGPKSAFPRMREAATRLQDLFRQLVPETFSRNPIQLGATARESLHYAYEQSAIFSYNPYSLQSLPTEDQLIGDLRKIVQIYTQIVSDPLTPELDLVVQTAIATPKVILNIEIKEFKKRPSKKPSKSEKAAGARRRYSPQSRKVGDAGERAVVRHEREKLTSQGRPDLVNEIRWHTEAGEFPGWDITSFDESGQKIFIEVKSSVGKTISSVDLTVNEWNAACNEKHCEQYFIYIVTNALSEMPTIEKMENPFGFVSRKELEIEPIVYELTLSAK